MSFFLGFDVRNFVPDVIYFVRSHFFFVLTSGLVLLLGSFHYGCFYVAVFHETRCLNALDILLGRRSCLIREYLGLLLFVLLEAGFFFSLVSR